MGYYKDVVIDGVNCTVEVNNNNSWRLIEYGGRPAAVLHPSDFQMYKMQLGDHITCEVVNRESTQAQKETRIDGVWTTVTYTKYINPMIRNLSGYGDMYNGQREIYNDITERNIAFPDFILKSVYKNNEWINIKVVIVPLAGENPPTTSYEEAILLVDGNAQYDTHFYHSSEIGLMWTGGSDYYNTHIDPFDLVIPNGITSINGFRGSAYSDDDHDVWYWVINNLTLGSGLKYIYGDCFQDAILGNTLVITENVELIGSHAFAGCNNITTIDFSRNTKLNYESFEQGQEDPSFVPPENINYAFVVYYYENNTRVALPTTVILGDQSLRDLWWTYYKNNPNYRFHWGREATFINGETLKYVCYDRVHGTQEFKLYKTPQGGYNRVFNVNIDGQDTTLYLPMVPMSDTVNGGDRVQFVPNVGSMRFKK